MIAGADRPFHPFSSTKPRIAPSSSFAHTTKTSAIGLLVIHILLPVSTYPPSALFARVAIPPGSDPWFGSVNPKHPIDSPRASFGSFLVDDELERGALIQVSTHELASSRSYYLIFPEEKVENTALGKFRDWIAGQAGNGTVGPVRQPG